MMQAVLARRDLTLGARRAHIGDAVPVFCFGPHEVQLERGGRLRVNRDALVTSAASGCLMSVVLRGTPALAAREAPGEEEVSSNLIRREP
jgi:hypothetical protein